MSLFNLSLDCSPLFLCDRYTVYYIQYKGVEECSRKMGGLHCGVGQSRSKTAYFGRFLYELYYLDNRQRYFYRLLV